MHPPEVKQHVPQIYLTLYSTRSMISLDCIESYSSENRGLLLGHRLTMVVTLQICSSRVAAWTGGRGGGVAVSGGLEWSACSVRIRLRPCLLPTAFLTYCLSELRVHLTVSHHVFAPEPCSLVVVQSQAVLGSVGLGVHTGQGSLLLQTGGLR